MKKALIITLTLMLTALVASIAHADAPIDATLCNNTTKPVEFHLFNHNDLSAGLVALTTKAVRACSCVSLQTHSDLWHNFPVARINQLVYRDVQSTTGASIKVCLDVTGKFEGYVDASVNTCAEAKKETKYLPAPELTRAQGDLPILQSRLHPSSSECQQKDWLNNCLRYTVEYDYTDGVGCFGN